MNKNAIIRFRDSDHSYFHGRKRFTSANKFLGEFGFHFDRDFWLPRSAMADCIPNYYRKYFAKGFNFEDRVPDTEVLIEAFQGEMDKIGLCLGEETAKMAEKWDQSAILGTQFHEEQEQLAYERGFAINPYDMKEYETIKNPRKPPKGFDKAYDIEYLKNLPDGFHPEIITSSIKHQIAGQVDDAFIETVDDIRYLDIGDHKTNSSKPKYELRQGYCRYPIDHLYDCTYAKYWLQVSLYAYLFELLGYTVRNVGFYHYENYDVSTKKVLTLKYLRNECRDMMDVHLEYNVK